MRNLARRRRRRLAGERALKLSDARKKSVVLRYSRIHASNNDKKEWSQGMEYTSSPQGFERKGEV